MRQVPTVVVATDRAAEQALIRYWLANHVARVVDVPVELGAAAMAAHAPDLVLVEGGPAAGAFVRELKQAAPGAAIALILERHASGPGADAVLRRPIALETLDALVAPLLDDRERAEEPEAGRQRRVLICDDDADFVHYASTVYARAGCDVTAALDHGTLLKKMPDLREVDLALVDLRMPDINGLQLCRFLRDTGGDELRICVVTAARDPESVKLGNAAGADGWLQKPVTAKALLALVGLGEQAAGAGPVPTPPAADAGPWVDAVVERDPDTEKLTEPA